MSRGQLVPAGFPQRKTKYIFLALYETGMCYTIEKLSVNAGVDDWRCLDAF